MRTRIISAGFTLALAVAGSLVVAASPASAAGCSTWQYRTTSSETRIYARQVGYESIGQVNRGWYLNATEIGSVRRGGNVYHPDKTPAGVFGWIDEWNLDYVTCW